MTESSLRQRAFCCFSLLSKKNSSKKSRLQLLYLLYLKNIFFSFPLHFLARICAHLRAHAREKVTRIAIIDRPLSMIVGGRVGALFFIVCFLSVYRYKSSVFVSLLPHGRLNEWKELGKNGQRGFEYGEFWLARASFSPFLCSFLCRRVIAYLLSSSSKKKSTTTHGGKSIFWERIPAFHFLKRDLSTVA